MIQRFNPDETEVITLPKQGNWPQAKHRFNQKTMTAVDAALASQRALLICGEPGVGKSQLARAVAYHLDRLFLSTVVNSTTEPQDLQWHFDAIGRLNDAQAKDSCHGSVEPVNYLSPEMLWWGFDYTSAEKQYNNAKYKKCIKPQKKTLKGNDWNQKDGCVLLIDEIDKAEPDLPNGLLEVLGNGAFSVPYNSDDSVVSMDDGLTPLVIFTTNKERQLPNAFIRRCLVLKLELSQDIQDWVDIGYAHFEERCSSTVYEEVATTILNDRKDAHEPGAPLPGQAEYLDILRALVNLASTEKEQLHQLKRVKEYFINKSSISLL